MLHSGKTTIDLTPQLKRDLQILAKNSGSELTDYIQIVLDTYVKAQKGEIGR